MATNPINQALRFVLELAALIAIGYWGWNQTSGLLQYILAIGLPLIIATAWGVFAVKDDPSRSGKTVIAIPGLIRLLLELGIFGFTCWALYDLGHVVISIVILVLVIVHYAVSYDRIQWLLKY